MQVILAVCRRAAHVITAREGTTLAVFPAKDGSAGRSTRNGCAATLIISKQKTKETIQMTIEEAITTLERIVDDNEEFGKKALSDSAIAAIEEGIRALKRQIPQEPSIGRSFIDSNYIYDACPECGNRLNYDGTTHPDFCDYCGQAIYWGEEE